MVEWHNAPVSDQLLPLALFLCAGAFFACNLSRSAAAEKYAKILSGSTLAEKTQQAGSLPEPLTHVGASLHQILLPPLYFVKSAFWAGMCFLSAIIAFWQWFWWLALSALPIWLS